MENTIYLHSVKKENFEIFFEINQNYDSVIDQLSSEFWKTLEETIKKTSGKPFTKLTNDNYCIDISIKGWKGFYIYIQWITDETIHLGLYNQNHRRLSADVNAISKLLTTEYKTDFNDSNICIYKSINENFTKLSGLKRLLPETRQEFCTEIIDEVYDLFQRTNKAIKEIEGRN